MKQTLITLKNNNGMQVVVSDFGARLCSIIFPTCYGPKEMLMRYQDENQFFEDPFYVGAICGRVANRIDKGRFSYDGQTYQYSQNDGEHCLHGGEQSIDKRFWHIAEQSPSSVTLTLESADGDNGFVGNVNIQVTYTLSDDEQLNIKIMANTDKVTPLNFTHHAYFNLGESNVESLTLKVASNSVLEVGEDNIPTGNCVSLLQSPLDFRECKTVQTAMQTLEQEQVNGIDNYFVKANEGAQEVPLAELCSVQNNVKLSVLSNQNGVQIYSGGFLTSPFDANSGICIEAQNFPDAMNHSHFESILVAPNAVYCNDITFKFSQLDKGK